MKRSRTIILILIIIGLCFPKVQATDTGVETVSIETVSVASMPDFGKWMLTSKAEPANWLGLKYKNKAIREPINIILIDGISQLPQEAVDHLIESCIKADYSIRSGHSSGYQGYIGGQLLSQLPSKNNTAFADGSFLYPNNHGRIFGPFFFDGKYYFSAAFSREAVNILQFTHVYVSFTKARDSFAASLVNHSDYKSAGKVNLENAISSSSQSTTGDHDGFALILQR